MVRKTNRSKRISLTLAQAASFFSVPAIAAVGAAAVSIPIIIHLMSRIRRKPEPWGAMRFLLEAYRRQKKKLQLEQWLLLATRCLLVLFAGLALAGPLFTGCSDGTLGLGTSGRVVYIVIDDALSTQTETSGGQIRLDGLKQQAIDAVNQMEPGDQAVVIRMAKPASFVIEEPTGDTDQLINAIQSIKPRYSGGQLIEALNLVDSSMATVDVRQGSGIVLLLSDFPRSAKYLTENVPPELESLGSRATIVTALPAQSTDNLQVMSVTPRRQMIVADGGAAIGTEIELRRFGGEQSPARANLQVRLLDSGNNVLATADREARWLTGQRTTLVNLDLPALLGDDELAGAGRELVVEAELVAKNQDAGVDSLPADNAARAVVRLRRQLRVALIDSEQKLNEQPGSLQPYQWVTAALAPSGPVGGSFEVTPVLPTAVTAGALTATDAAIVLRPDELTTRGWDVLEEFANDGGLVWVFAPATMAQPKWAQTMARVFDLPWQFGEELLVFEADDDTAAADLPSVDQTTPAPSDLQFLAADWREKLGWIDVAVRVPFTAEDEHRWIRMQPADSVGAGPTLMAAHDIGRGTLVFTATALDTRFTNLPARALFVPLLHDTLRGVLGANAGMTTLVAGDKPELDSSWRGAGELEMIGDGDARLMVESMDATVVLRDAAEQPGVYSGRAGGSPRLLVINAEADAGDTFTAQPQLEQLLDKLGGWSYWSDREERGGVLARTNVIDNLTWPLLWIVLGLLLLETVLARRYSHATDTSKPTVVGRVLGALHGSGSSSGSAKAASATGGQG